MGNWEEDPRPEKGKKNGEPEENKEEKLIVSTRRRDREKYLYVQEQVNGSGPRHRVEAGSRVS